MSDTKHPRASRADHKLRSAFAWRDHPMHAWPWSRLKLACPICGGKLSPVKVDTTSWPLNKRNVGRVEHRRCGCSCRWIFVIELDADMRICYHQAVLGVDGTIELAEFRDWFIQPITEGMFA